MSSEEHVSHVHSADIDQQRNDFWYYMWILQKRLWLLVSVFVVGMTGTLLYISILKPEYKATAQLLITTAKPGSVADDDYTGASYFQTEGIMDTQKELLKNLTLAEDVVTRLGYDKDSTEVNKQEPTLFQRVNRFVRRLIWTTKREGASEQPVVTQQAQAILAGLEVERLKGTRVINVSYRSSDPEKAAKVINELIKAHMDQEKQRRFKVTKEKLDWLQEQAENRRTALQKAEQDLNDYQKRMKDVSFRERLNIVEDRLNSLNKALHDAETLRMEAEATRNRLLEHMQGGRALDSFPKVSALAGDESDKIRCTLVDFRSQEASLVKKYGPKHPQMIKVRDQIKALEEQLNSLSKKAMDRIESEYQIAKTRVGDLKKALEEQKKLIFDLNERAIEYNSKNIQVETQRQLLQQLFKEVSEAGLSQTIKESNIQVVSEARIPTEPSGPKRFYSLAVGTLLSLVTGCVLALLLEFVDSSVKTGDEIERYVKAPFLGLIDKYESDGTVAGSKEPAYLVTLHAPKSNTSENFRKIRTNIIFSSPEANRRTLLVTSAVPREGKTLVASNLAIVMAQSGKRVLLIDSDLRRPMVHKVLGLENTKGLSSYLAGLANFDGILASTPIENLTVVTSGPIPPNQSELLGSEPMRAFLSEATKRFDLTILDCAPVTSVADALVLGSMVDGVIEVVKSHSTARGLLEQSTQHLRDVNAKLIGIILNMVDFQKTGYAYGKYYSYRYYGYYDYSYYSSEEEPKLQGGGRAPRPRQQSTAPPGAGQDVKT